MPRLEDLRIKKAEPEKVSEKTPEKIERPEPKPAETSFASVYESVSDRPVKDRSKYGLWVVAVGSVAFLLFALSFLFTKAKVVVIPKVADVNLNETLSAVKTGNTEETDSLPFDLVVLEGTESKTVPAGAEQEVTTPATGRVVIYNAYSAAPQPLAIETRLEGSNGKIYKTDTKLTVPGMKGDTPGSIEVGIHAAEPGPEYNGGPLDFKIFGFKRTPKYAKFYARGKGDLSGGFVGKSNIVAPEDKEKAVAELKIGLQSKLFKKATDQLPPGFILFKGASTLGIPEENIQMTTEAGVTTMSVKGTFSGILFEEKKLTKKIAETAVPKYDGGDVYIPNIQNLNFSLSGVPIPLGEMQSAVFSLSGPAKVVWRVDADKLAQDMLGKKKKDFNQILSKYPGIASAQLVLRPFWKTSFPEKSKSIEITVNYPK